MTSRVLRTVATITGLCFGTLGCAIATDLINPAALSALGLDPATIIPPEGRALVTFNNMSSLSAIFVIAVSDNPGDPTSNAQTIFSEILQPNQAQTASLDCPVGVLTPGTPAADFSTGTTAVFVAAGDDGVEVTYNGAPLIFGTDFVCGDLVEMRLVQTGNDATMADSFQILMRVIPGR